MNELLQLEEEVDEEIYRRARQDLLAFTIATKEDYEVGWHHLALAKKLNDWVEGKIRYLMVFMPPRHGKSELVSRRLPAYIHGRFPNSEIMAASYLDSLAGDMTQDVQKIMDSVEYQKIFPDTRILPPRAVYTKGTRNSSEHTIIGQDKGKYRGQGVGGSFTGKGANFIIIDDPIKGREIADSVAFRERLWNFWTNDLKSRLETDLKTGRKGQALITQCMTGDTRVLMSDGSETFLRDIKIGNSIATYDNGSISSSVVKNWKNCGPDLVYAIRMSSGITVKANERHPFLVYKNGETEWVRLKDLRVTDKLICVGVHCKGKNVLSGGVSQQLNARECACPTTTKKGGHQVTDLPHAIQTHKEKDILSIGTELLWRNTSGCSKSKMENALYVEPTENLRSTGSKDCVLTTVTEPEKSEDCFAMNAISLLSTETPKKSCLTPLSIYEPTLDSIAEISQYGYEDVFDIQVDRTENFIANYVAAHNTRWHEDDLSGRLMDLMRKDQQAIQWEIVHFPAIRVNMDNPDDPRPLGAPLWPEKYDLKDLEEIKAGTTPRGWSALYQQDPIPDGGGLFAEHMFKFCRLPSKFQYCFTTADTAYKDKQVNDFTVFSVWGWNAPELFLIDVYRKQVKSSLVEAEVHPFLQSHLRYGYRGTWIEPKGHGIYLNQKWASSNLVIPSEEDIKAFYDDRRMDKVERANNVVPHLARNVVYINQDIACKEDLVLEALGFPNAMHDDWVDTLIDALKKVFGGTTSILDVT